MVKYSLEQLEAMEKNPWLTDRERAAFELVLRRGMSYIQAAQKLFCSESTIGRLLKSIRDKSNIRPAVSAFCF